jgi:hypothetical protein
MEVYVRRIVALTIPLIFLGGVALGADHQGKGKKHHKDTPVAASESHDRGTATITVSWGTRDIEAVRRYYAPRYRNLPPGLQKKYARTGQLPPGWQKKMEPLPESVERECTPLPAGYRRGVIDAHAVIYDSRGTIVDVAVLF